MSIQPDIDSLNEDDLLATMGRLAARLPEPIETPEEKGLALEMLSDATEEARTHGNPSWTRSSAPPGVINIVLKAAARGYMNPSGYTEEAADSARLKRGADYVRGAEFTDTEIRRIRALAEFRGVTYSTSTRNDSWRSRSDRAGDGTHYVPIADGHGNWRWMPWGSVDQAGRIH